MPFDYDLVILGGSLAARYAAAKASRLGARVALVEPDAAQNNPAQNNPAQNNIELSLLRHAAFRQLRTLVEQMGKMASSGIWQGSPAADSALVAWEKSLKWIQETTEMIAANEIVGHSLPQLAAVGVDIVLGEAAFYPASKAAPKATFKQRWRSMSRSSTPPVVLAGGRYLRSRKYLLAPTATAVIPEIEGLSATNYRTIESFWQNPWTTLPPCLTILGSDPRGIELAQLFNRLGCQVTLIVSGTQLLPDEDASTIALLQAHLEAEGIEILTQTRVTQAKQLGNQTWIQAGDRAFQTDALLLATRVQPNLAAFNLEAVGVAGDQSLRVNHKLQTTHAQIYACGDILGGYALPHLAEHEVDVALDNALFCTSSRVNYGQIPWAIFTSPTLARIGLTESQARAFYGEDVVVLQQSLQSLSRAQVQQETIGWCKLIVRRNGEILGGHSLSPQAEEWIGTIALAMKHPIKLGAINAASFLPSTSSEILTHLIRQWQERRFPAWQRDLLENWFNARRS